MVSAPSSASLGRASSVATEETKECCEPMKMALDYARLQHKPLAGIVHAFLFGNKGRITGNHLVYHIPAYGRGKERVQGKNILLNLCPFCGHEFQKVEGTEQVMVVKKPVRKLEMGIVSSEAILSSPGLRLDARYHLDAPPARKR
jgi:hypothetical protein